MSKQKVMVLSVESRFLVVMTQAGEFRRVKRPLDLPGPGQTVLMEVGEYRVWPRYLRPVTAAAAALILFLALGWLPLALSPAVASVTLDMTPSMQLAVDQEGKVVAVESAGGEADELLHAVTVKGMDIYQAVGELTAKALELGFLDQQETNFIFIAITPLRSGAGSAPVGKDDVAAAISAELTKKNANGYVIAADSSKSQLKRAEAEGLSVNRYLIREQARKNGIDLPGEVIKKQNLNQLLRQKKEDRVKLFPGAWRKVPPNGSENTDGQDSRHELREDGQGMAKDRNQGNTAGGRSKTNTPGFKEHDDREYDDDENDAVADREDDAGEDDHKNDEEDEEDEADEDWEDDAGRGSGKEREMERRSDQKFPWWQEAKDQGDD